MANEKNQTNDPTDHVSGSISEFISESTMIPESALVLPDESGHGDGPQVLEGNDNDNVDGFIPESTSTAPNELPGKESASGSSSIKKNLPFIAFGVIAVALLGAVGLKMTSSSLDAPAATQEQVASSTPEPVKASPVESATPEKSPVTEDPSVISPTPEAAASYPESLDSSAQASASDASPEWDMYMPKKQDKNAPDDMPIAVDGTSSESSVQDTDDWQKYIPKPQDKGAVAAVSPESASVATPAATKVAPVKADCNCAVVQEKRPVQIAKKQVSQVKRVKKAKPTPLPSTEGYQVHMGANGLAWVKLPGGEMRVVAQGDRIEGLGTVKEIDSRNHLIKVGRVTLR